MIARGAGSGDVDGFRGWGRGSVGGGSRSG
jgi:hypothetical protein